MTLFPIPSGQWRIFQLRALQKTWNWPPNRWSISCFLKFEMVVLTAGAERMSNCAIEEFNITFLGCQWSLEMRIFFFETLATEKYARAVPYYPICTVSGSKLILGEAFIFKLIPALFLRIIPRWWAGRWAWCSRWRRVGTPSRMRTPSGGSSTASSSSRSGWWPGSAGSRRSSSCPSARPECSSASGLCLVIMGWLGWIHHSLQGVPSARRQVGLT